MGKLEFLEKSRPRWLIFIIDICICLFSLMLAYLLRFNFASIPQVEIDSFPKVFPYVLGTRALSFFISKIYKGIIRYTSSKDAQRIFVVTTLASIFFAISNIISYYLIYHHFVVPYSIIVIEYMCTAFLMISLRLTYKSNYLDDNRRASSQYNEQGFRFV